MTQPLLFVCCCTCGLEAVGYAYTCLEVKAVVGFDVKVICTAETYVQTTRAKAWHGIDVYEPVGTERYLITEYQSCWHGAETGIGFNVCTFKCHRCKAYVCTSVKTFKGFILLEVVAVLEARLKNTQVLLIGCGG